MSKERAMGLLYGMVADLLVAEKSTTVIRKLLKMGFTHDELVNEFYFYEPDIVAVETEMKECND